MDPSEFKMEVHTIEDFDAPEDMVVPIPKQYGGDLDVNLDHINAENIASPDISESTNQAIGIIKQTKLEGMSTETISPTSRLTDDPTITTPMNATADMSRFSGSPEHWQNRETVAGNVDFDMGNLTQGAGHVSLDSVSNMTVQSPVRGGMGMGGNLVSAEDAERHQALERKEAERMRAIYAKSVLSPHSELGARREV